MTALANVGANSVWQTVKLLELNQGSNEVIERILRDLKVFLATQGKNPKLQVLEFSDAQVTTAGGVQLGTGTPKVYAVYVKKGATATKSYIKINDDATDDTTAANQRIVLPLLAASDEALYIDPNPTAFANGIVVGADTTVNGTTDSTAGDAGTGFVIVG